jgi:hypothetical protein
MNAPTSRPTNKTRNRLLSILCMTAALAGGVASAMADDGAAALPEVLLNSGEVTLPAADARLIRTAMTPSEVNLAIPVGYANTVCTQYAQVPHTGQNGLQCGYDHLIRRVCRDIPGECHVIDARTGRKACAPTTRDCRNETIDQARVCTWLETECVRTDIAQSTELRNVKLKFKNAARLAAGETEAYDIHSSQTHLDGSDAKFSLSPISTKRPMKVKAKDGLFTGFADVIKIQGN